MKKQLTALLTTALLLTCLTGCNTENNSSQTSNSSSEKSTSTNSEIPNNTSDIPPAENKKPSDSTSSPKITVEKGKYKEVFKDGEGIVSVTAENKWVVDDFIAKSNQYGTTHPDKSEINPSDVVKIYGYEDGLYSIGFDYAFISVSKQNVKTNIDYPNLDLWSEADKQPVSNDYIRIQAGDVLDNGLKVTSAYYYQDFSMGDWSDKPYLNTAHVETEGELTLNGILIGGSFENETPENSNPDKKTVFYFIPCNNNLPVYDIWAGTHYTEVFGFKAIHDAPKFYLDITEELSENISTAFSEKNSLKAKVTIKNPQMGFFAYKTGGFNYSAELVSYEIIDG